jgi:hypothetical protein
MARANRYEAIADWLELNAEVLGTLTHVILDSSLDDAGVLAWAREVMRDYVERRQQLIEGAER